MVKNDGSSCNSWMDTEKIPGDVLSAALLRHTSCIYDFFSLPTAKCYMTQLQLYSAVQNNVEVKLSVNQCSDDTSTSYLCMTFPNSLEAKIYSTYSLGQICMWASGLSHIYPVCSLCKVKTCPWLELRFLWDSMSNHCILFTLANRSASCNTILVGHLH